MTQSFVHARTFVLRTYAPAAHRAGSEDSRWESSDVVSERTGASTVDERYLVDALSRLARVPTDVPLGFDTLMEPDDPKLVHYVQDVVRPELAAIGVYDLLDVPRKYGFVSWSRPSKADMPPYIYIGNDKP